jgi:hypothetical protein
MVVIVRTVATIYFCNDSFSPQGMSNPSSESNNDVSSDSGVWSTIKNTAVAAGNAWVNTGDSIRQWQENNPIIMDVLGVAAIALEGGMAVKSGSAIRNTTVTNVSEEESNIPKLAMDLQLFASKGGSNPRIISKISDNSALVKEAEKMSSNQRIQQEANHLIEELLQGNTNPGLGSKNLFKDVSYLRGRNGARVFYRNVDGTIEILGKSSKANEQKVIDILNDMYNK